MDKNKTLLSIVIPLYNEEPTIGDVISRLKTTLRNIGLAYEIIVVDDYSEDRSVETSRNQSVKVYSLRRHMGKGYALRAGFAKAKGQIIATIDSDGSHRPEELSLLLAPILQNRADLVIGSRFSGGESVSGKPFNVAGVRLFNFLVKVFTRTSVSDSQSGYRAMKSAVLEHLSLSSDEYQIETEMLMKTAMRHFRVTEVPISFEQRTYGRSRLDPIVDGFKILLSIITSYMKG
jgi:glycosyltransferase involved in cell wall biosynthesis